MDIIKSSRHQKIIGDFGESIICNWLSRSGFEVTVVDHTGIDIIAFNPSTNERLGITVKSRTRKPSTEQESVNLLSYQRGRTIARKSSGHAEHSRVTPGWRSTLRQPTKQMST